MYSAVVNDILGSKVPGTHQGPLMRSVDEARLGTPLSLIFLCARRVFVCTGWGNNGKGEKLSYSQSRCPAAA